MNLLQEFKNYLFSQEVKPSKVTVKNYLSDVNNFTRWFEQSFNKPFSPTEVTKHVIDNYKLESSEKLSASSVERHLSSLRKFFSFLKAQNLTSIDPFKPLVQVEAHDPWHIKDFKSNLYVFKASHLTIKNYLIDIKQFLNWAEEVTGVNKASDSTSSNVLNYINSDLVEEYKQRLISQGIFSPSTINRKLSSLRKYVLWLQTEGLLGKVSIVSGNIEDKIQAQINLPKPQVASIPAEFTPRVYSSFPPLRLFQKLTKGISLALDATLISQIVNLIEAAEHLAWKTKGQPVFSQAKKIRIPAFLSHEDLLGIKNIKKEIYAPLEISTKNFPWYKKTWFTLKYQRPNWYRTYHSYAIVHYFHFAVLIIFVAGLAFGFYNGFVSQGSKNLTLAANVPTNPPRILSFQGRLTDNNDNPVTSGTNLRFAIYNSPTASGGALLWQEVNLVSPDTDGIFNAILGNVTSIPQSLFSENNALWLGVTVGVTPELTPRQQLATVAFAANSETLQGLLPITATSAGTTNVVLALNSSGNLVIGGSATPTFQSTGGQFTISGQAVLITTNAGSNSNVILQPDGLGKIELNKPIVNNTLNNNIATARGSVEVDDLLSVLATSSGQSAFTLNQDGAGPLISASASGVQRFTVDNAGNVFAAGDLQLNGGDITSGNTAITIDSGSANSVTLGASDAFNISGNFSQTGTTTFSTGTGLVSINGNINTNLIPNSSSSNLGSLTNYWGALYANNIYPATSSIVQGFLQRNNGALSPTYVTDDFLFGGTSTSSALFRITGGNKFTGTSPVASISANTSFAALVVDNKGSGDLIVASSSAIGTNTQRTQFQVTGAGALYTRAFYDLDNSSYYLDPAAAGLSINTAGSASISSNLTFATGASSVQSTARNTLTIGGNTTGQVVLAGFGGAVNGVTFSGYSTCTLKTDSSGIVTCGTDISGGVPTLDLYWNQTLGALYPNNSTVDFLIGGQSTASADFAITGISSLSNQVRATLSGELVVMANNGFGGNATLSGKLTLGTFSDPTIQTTRNQGLTIGGNTTGQIIFSPNNTQTLVMSPNRLSLTGASTVDSTGALSLNTVSNQTITTGTGLVTTGGDIQVNGNDIQDSAAAARITFSTNTITLGSTTTLTATGLTTITSSTALNLNPNTGTTYALDTSATTLTAFGTPTSFTLGGAATTFNIGPAGSTATSINLAGGSGATGCTVDGATGNLTCSGNVVSNGVALLQNYWVQNLGALFPTNSTLDFLFGSQATVSSRFRLVANNLGAGTLTVASISGRTSFATLVINNDGVGDLITASASGWTRFKIANSGALTSSAYTIGGGIIYTTSNGLFSQTTAGSSNECLKSTGGGTPTWGTCGTGGSGNSPFTELLGAIVPNNSTEDLLIGGQATTSAIFALINVNSGTPTLKIWDSTAHNNSLNLSATATEANITAATGIINIGQGGGTLYVQTDIQNDSTNNLGAIQITDRLNVLPATTSNVNSNAALIVNNPGTGDIFTASAGGTQIFTLTNAGGIRLGTNEGLANNCLLSGGVAAAATWNTCPFNTTDTFWNQTLGALYPNNSTVDFLIGGQSTASAKFRVTGASNRAGTDSVASIAGRTSFAAFVIDNQGVGDLFTASSSGASRFAITRSGDIYVNSVKTVSTNGGSNSLFLGNGGVSANNANFSVSVGRDALNSITTGDNNTAVGYQAGLELTSGISNTLVGHQAGGRNNGDYNTLIGEGTGYGGTSGIANFQNVGLGYFSLHNLGNNDDTNTALGYQSALSFSGGDNNIFIGADTGATNGVNSSIIIGVGGSATANNQLLLGSSSNLGEIYDVYVGQGVVDAAPTGVTINATGGTGTNIVGGGLTLAGGKGTGNAAGGDIIFQTSDQLGTGSSLQSLTTKMIINEFGKIGIGLANTTPLATVDIRGQTSLGSNGGTIPVASISGLTSFAALVVNNDGVGDIFTASRSGGNKFVIANNGNVGIGQTIPLAKIDIKNVSRAAQGSEKITSSNDNGFTTDTGNWTTSGSPPWKINVASSGLAAKDAPGTGALTLNNAALDSAPAAGTMYKIEIDYTTTASSSGSVSVSFGGTSFGSFGGGSNEDTFVYGFIEIATNTNALTFTPTSNWYGTIDNVFIWPVTPTSIALRIESSNGTSTPIEVRPGQSGNSNIFVGQNSGRANITGSSNNAFGTGALSSNYDGSNNNAFGVNALAANASGWGNTAMGDFAIRDNVVGILNTGIGYEALWNNTYGNYNSALGYIALSNNTSGYGNTGVGHGAIDTNSSGYYNNGFGYLSDVGLANLYNATAIGSFARVDQSSSLVLGSINGINSATASARIGIGTTAPYVTFDVRGGSGTLAVASFSGTTSFATLVSNNDGVGDLFTASKSGRPIFTVRNNGQLTLGAPYYTAGCTALETNSSGTVVCGVDDSGGGANWWNQLGGALSPVDVGYDFLLGGSTTSSASTKFSFTGIKTGQTIASISGQLVVAPNNGYGGNIVPAIDNKQSIGASPSARWKDLFLGPASLHIQCKTTDAGCPASQNIDYSFNINSAGTLGIGANLNSSLTPTLNITQGGNVGIGTTAPLATVDARGNSASTPIASFSGNITSGDTFVISNNVANTGILAVKKGGTTVFGVNTNNTAFGYGTGGAIIIGSPGGESGITIGNTNRADIRFDDSTLKLLAGGGSTAPVSTAGIAITTGGQVGVGTTNPDGLQLNLTVNQNAQGVDNLRLGVASDGTPRIIFEDNGFIQHQIDNSAGTMRFFRPGIISMTINESGRVGIGNFSSGHTGILNVNANSGVDNALVVLNQSGTGDIIAASASGTSQFRLSNNGSIYSRSFNDLDNTSYFIDPAASGTALAVNGNVGIGTTSPLAINASAPLFAGVTPKMEIITGTATATDYEELVVIRHNSNDAAVHSRRVGLLLKTSSESSTGESAKSGGLILDSNAAFGNGPSLSLVTANVSRLTILSGGNVGIGTTSPRALLDVNGIASVSGNIYMVGNTNGNASSVWTGFYDSNLRRTGWVGDGATGDSNMGLGADVGNINFFTGGATQMTLDTSGNLGIGTVTPKAELDISGSVSASGNLFFTGVNAGPIVYLLNGKDLAFYSSVGGLGSTSVRMTLSNNGNLGVGNSAPSYRLDITPGSTTGTGLRISDNATNPGVALLAVGDDTFFTDVDVANTLGLYSSTSTTIGNLKLGSGGPILYGAGGGLGIGASPASGAELDVTGEAIFRGRASIEGTGATCSAPAAGTAGFWYADAGDCATVFAGIGTDTNAAETWRVYIGGDRMVVNSAGNVTATTFTGDLSCTGCVAQTEIAASGVGSGETKTSTSVATCASGTGCDITGSTYQFTPSWTDTSTREHCVSSWTSNADPGNQTSRWRAASTDCTGVASNGTHTSRWRYITASDHPTLWMVANADGTLTQTGWESEDPIDPTKWPENPNPIEGTDLKPGQYFVSPEFPSVTEIKKIFSKFPQADQEQILLELKDYIVDKRGWLTSFDSLDDLDKINERYHHSGRQWAIRYLSNHYKLAVPISISLFTKVVDGKLIAVDNAPVALQAYRDAEAALQQEEAAIPADAKKADIAEWYSTDGTNLEQGDILEIGDHGLIGRATKEKTKKIMGVISSYPGQILGMPQSEKDVKVALSGRVPTKVSSENGPIKAGDALTVSSIPGVAAKATVAGDVVGKALEDYENPDPQAIGKILVFVNVSWYDPDVYLANTEGFTLATATTSAQLNVPSYYSITDVLGTPVKRVGIFTEAAIANLKVGGVSASEIVTNALNVTSENININGSSIRDYIASIVNDIINNTNSNIISPIASVDSIHTNLISPVSPTSKVALKLEDDKVSILDGNSSSSATVTSFDNKGNATLSGSLAVGTDASINGTLRASRIIADQIEGLNIQSASISASYITNNYYNSSNSAFPTLLATPSNVSSASSSLFEGLFSSNNFINIATFSSELAYVENLNSANAAFSQNLTVYGSTLLSDTSVVGQLAVNGSLILADNSINVLGSDLNLQPLRQGGLSVMAGLFYIDTNGNVTTEGDATVKGTLFANAISPIPGQDLAINLGTTSGFLNPALRINNASGAAILAINQKGDLTASGAATFGKLNIGGLIAPALAVSPTEVIATGSAGTGVINAGRTQMTINNNLVNDKSLIYITPTSTTNQTIFLLRQVPNESFTVGIQNPSLTPIKFNWIIVN